MTSTGQLPEPWKSTAATLFNPYLNLNQKPNPPRQQSIRTHIVTPNRHSRAPPESLIDTGSFKLTSSDLLTRPKSKKFPPSNSAEEVSIYIQQMIHNQFCGRSGTPSDMRYDDQKLRQPTHTPPQSRLTTRRTGPSTRQQSRVSEYALDDFFNTADEQMSRMASLMPGRESSFSESYSYYGESPRHRSNAGERVTLAHVCDIASDVGDKMSQSKEKVGQEAIRGYRLPSARLPYEPYEHHPMDPPLVLGQHPVNDPIRLSDVLTDDNFSTEPMIEVVGSELIDDKSSRTSRIRLKSTSPSKTTEFKDWRGKISQPNLPDVRSRLKRQQSASVISPQRPCTAASNPSKSRPDSSGILLINDSQKLEEPELENLSSTGNIYGIPVNSVLKSSSHLKQRQRNRPLSVRIDETIYKQDSNEVVSTDPPRLSVPSESLDEQLKTTEIMPGPTPDQLNSKSTTPFPGYDDDSSDKVSTRKAYKLIRSSSQQVYRTVAQPNETNKPNQNNEQFTQLTLSQLELLENYDPMISARIGVPFIPVQMLARPRDAHQSAKRSIEEIEKEYPRKNGQPVFEGRSTRSTNNLIDIAQTLQLTKSKRVPVERQTTFEKPENEAIIKEAIQIKALENPNRLALAIYPSPEQHSLVKHVNSTRSPTKHYPSQLDNISLSTRTNDQQTHISDRTKEEDRIEYNLSVLNIRTQQVVDQIRRREKPNPIKRPVFPTSIVTNVNLNSPRQKPVKPQGRPISSVFITQDPDEMNYSASVYRQAKNDVDIKRAFKGYVVQNLQRKLSADERKKREEEQQAAVKIQRAYREHLNRRQQIENRRPSTSQRQEQEREHRRLRSAKRAQFVEQQLVEQTRIRKENKQYEKMINDTGPSLQIYASFNPIGAQFSKATLNRAATCIQRWWRGFIVRHRWDFLKREVTASGRTWFDFSARYRGVVQRIQKMRHSEYRQFVINLNQARDFLIIEKKLSTIYDALSFNDKLDQNELEKFFEACDLSVIPSEIQEALQSVLQSYPPQKNDSLTREMVFDIVYYIFPPAATGLESSRKSTWVRPIIDGEDETAIAGTPFLEPIHLDVIYKFLGKQ